MACFSSSLKFLPNIFADLSNRISLSFSFAISLANLSSPDFPIKSTIIPAAVSADGANSDDLG